MSNNKISIFKKRSLKLKAESKDELRKHKNQAFKPSLHFFIDPIPCHRVYRDFIIPDYDNNIGSPIYSFKSFPKFKQFSQIHIREKGIIFQFTEIDAEYITPLGILQTRLNSLGSKEAHELADFLTIYYEHFEKIDSKTEQISCKQNNGKKRFYEPILPETSTNAKLVSYIDKIFEDYQEKVLFISVSQRLKGLDERVMMLGYSREMIDLLHKSHDYQGKIFEDDYREIFRQMFCSFSYEGRISEILEFLSAVFVKDNEKTTKNTYSRYMKTVFGHIKVELTFKQLDIEIDGINFKIFCSSLEDNKENSWIYTLLKNKQKYLDMKVIDAKNKEKKESKTNTDWEKLLKCYYPKIMDTHK